MADQSCFDVAFLGIVAQAKKIEQVGVFEDFLGQDRTGGGQAADKVGNC